MFRGIPIIGCPYNTEMQQVTIIQGGIHGKTLYTEKEATILYYTCMYIYMRIFNHDYILNLIIPVYKSESLES